MGLKVVLVVLSWTLVITQCEATHGGLTCSRFTDITVDHVQLLVNRSGTPCVRCLDNPNSQVNNDTIYFLDGNPAAANDHVVVIGGVLIIMNAWCAIPDDYSPVLLSCQVLGGFTYNDIELISGNLSPPTVSPESLTINEGDDNMNIFCLSSSPRALDVVEMWLNPQMMVAEEGVGNALSFVNISRSQSGVYICTLTSLVTNETESEDFRVTVHFRPDATTRVDPDTEIILERTLTLTCGFDGVPTPDVTWTQNNTIELRDNDSRITTTTTANAGGSRVATLEITGIDRDGGGLYTCGFNNSVGDREVSVTTVLILIPPAPVTDLINTTYEEELITITWTKGFDGFTPITGATIEYTPDEGSTTVHDVPSSDPTTATLTDLMPFTNYTISVSLFNVAGTGDATVIQVHTRSGPPTAPQAVTLTGLTSFALRVTWEPPEDDGGQPIASYIVSVAGLTFTPPASARMLRIVNNMVLMEDTSYTVTVMAQNMMDSNGGGLTGPAATATANTLSIDQPQSLLDKPIAVNIMNTSAALSWVDPGGDVDAYIIRLTQNFPPNLVINVSVNGDLTITILRGLEPDSSYTVEVFSMNQNGLSIIPSPLTHLDTLPPLPPVVTSNIKDSSDGMGTVLVGTTVVLTCTTTDTRPIIWRERSRNISLVTPVFVNEGDTSISTLTINNIQTEHDGDYVCEVREVTTNFQVIVEMRNSSCRSCSSTSHALAASISAIIAAVLATTIIVLVLIAIIRWHLNKTPASEKKEHAYEAVELDKEDGERE